MNKSILTFIFIVTILVFISCTSATYKSSNSNESINPVNSDSIDYSSAPYSLKVFDYVGECVLSKSLSNDTLTIELLSANIHFFKKPHLKFIFQNDTLSITTRPESIQIDSIIYNKDKSRYDTLHFMEEDGRSISILGPKYKLETFRFYKQKKCPTTIYLDGKFYNNCPTKDIEYKTYNGSIINRINKDGFKDGIWLEFHETGELKEKKYYDNGIFLNGKTFDKNGKDLHYVCESSGSIVTLQIDN